MELVRNEEEGIVEIPLPMQGIVDLYVNEHVPDFILENWQIRMVENISTLVLKVRRIQ